jgi:hypothetical protein
MGDPILIAHGQFLHEHRSKDGEHRHRRADARTEDDHCRYEESGGAPGHRKVDAESRLVRQSWGLMRQMSPTAALGIRCAFYPRHVRKTS